MCRVSCYFYGGKRQVFWGGGCTCVSCELVTLWFICFSVILNEKGVLLTQIAWYKSQIEEEIL